MTALGSVALPALLYLPAPLQPHLLLLFPPAPDRGRDTLQVGGCQHRPHVLLEQGARDIAVDPPGVASSDGACVAAREP